MGVCAKHCEIPSVIPGPVPSIEGTVSVSPTATGEVKSVAVGTLLSPDVSPHLDSTSLVASEGVGDAGGTVAGSVTVGDVLGARFGASLSSLPPVIASQIPAKTMLPSRIAAMITFGDANSERGVSSTGLSLDRGAFTSSPVRYRVLLHP